MEAEVEADRKDVVVMNDFRFVGEMKAEREIIPRDRK